MYMPAKSATERLRWKECQGHATAAQSRVSQPLYREDETEDIEESCKGERKRPFLEQGDESILLDYSVRICLHWYGKHISDPGKEAFSDPSLRVNFQ